MDHRGLHHPIRSPLDDHLGPPRTKSVFGNA